MKTVAIAVVALVLGGIVFHSYSQKEPPGTPSSETTSESTDKSPKVADSVQVVSEADRATNLSPGVSASAAPAAVINSGPNLPISAAVPLQPTETITFESSLFREVAEHQSVTETGKSILGYHRRVEAEARDPSWSYRAEQEIGDLAAAQVSNGTVKLDRVECRTTLCEVQLSRPAQAPPEGLSAAMAEIHKLGSSGSYRMLFSTTIDSVQDGTSAAIVVLERSSN